MNSRRQSKHWHVLGAGAMGCLWTAALRAAGHDVTLLLRDEPALAAFRRNRGITMTEGQQRTEVGCAARLATTVGAPIDHLLICCKAHQTLSAVETVSAQLRRGALALLVQNGMGVAEALLQVRPDLRLFCGVSTDGAHLLARFNVRRAGRGMTQLGRFPAESEGIAGNALCAALEQPVLKLRSCPDIYGAQWHKLALNSVINPLTAIFDIRNGDLPAHVEARSWIPPLCREVAEVSHSQGIELSATSLEERVAEVCASTAGNVSSMLQDVRQGRQTEIDHINGYLIAVGRRHGLDCPTHRQVAARVTAARYGERG